jgi:hypothetical protein
MAGCDTVDLILDRAGVGVDIDAGAVQRGVIGSGWVVRAQSWRSHDARRNPSGEKLRGKPGAGTRLPRHFVRVPLSAKTAPKSGKKQ